MKKRIFAITLIIILIVSLFAFTTNAANVMSSSAIEAAVRYCYNEKDRTDRPAQYWHGYCAALVWAAYNKGAKIGNSSYATARQMGDALLISNTSNPPRGALVFWYLASNPQGAAGHVGLSLGDGNVIHAWGKSGNSVTVSSISYVNSCGYTYRGWGAPLKGYTFDGAAATMISAPAKPSVSLSDYQNNSVKLSWNSVSGASYYEVQYKSHKTGEWKKDADYKSGTSYTSKGLSGNPTWEYRVRACNAGGCSDWATITYYKVTESAPAQKTTVTPKAEAPTISASSVNAPSNVKYGNSFGLRGEFSSNGTITKVVGQIMQNGTAKQQQIIYPNSSSVNIRYTAINDNLVFNKLSKGAYKYNLIVYAEKNGQTTKWTNGGVQFTVS